VYHRTIQINHQPDATIFQFIILTFVYSSTCFGRFPAHHQELHDFSGSLWFYRRIVVTVVLCSWSGRPAFLIGSTTLHDLLIIKASRSHSDTPRSVRLLWTGDQPVAETSTWQHTTFTWDRHLCPGGIRTHNPSKRAAVNPRPRVHGDWNRDYHSCTL
jgi:hypothetical protein